MGHDKYRTNHLFADNGFLIGAGAAINIGGSYFSYNISETPEEADAKAVESDWGTVGCDIGRAMGCSREILD